MAKVSFQALALFALGAQGVSFTSWRGLGCRGEILHEKKGLNPYTCYTAVDASSIEAYGLQNRNSPDSYIEIFSDRHCNEYKSTIKYSGYCTETNYQSVRLFIPAVGEEGHNTKREAGNETTADLGLVPFDTLTEDQRAVMDDNLDAVLLAIEKDALGGEQDMSSDEGEPTRPRLGMSIVSRADGDRHVYRQDRSVTGIEVEDNNSPGDSGGFSFANAQQRSSWVSTVFQRLTNTRRQNGDDESYQSGVTIGDHDLDLDIELTNGTLQNTELSLFRKWLAMFAQQRDGHSHQVWNLYHNHRLQATITLKAYR